MPDLASEVTFQDEKKSTRRIPTGSILALAMLGVTERGPFIPTMNTDFVEYQQSFGGYIATSDVPTCAKAFFDEGGSRLIVQRTVHYTDNTDPTTKTSAAAVLALLTASAGASAGSVTGTVAGPWTLNASDDLSIIVDSNSAADAVFTATQATRSAVNAAPYALSDGQNLTVKVNGGTVQTVTFHTSNFASIGAATAAEVAAVINAGLVGASCDVASSVPRIRSDRKGSSASIQVTGGTANTALGYVTTVTNGTGNVADISAVTFTEAKTIIEAAVAGCTVTSVSSKLKVTSNTTGASSLIHVNSGSLALAAFGLDAASHAGAASGAQTTLTVNGKTDGAYANALSIRVSAATSGAASDFKLDVLKGGVRQEGWDNANLNPTSPRYIVTLINLSSSASNLITITDNASTIASPGNIPATGTFGPMAGGTDGLTSLADTDFVGSVGINGPTGLRCFDAQAVDVVCVPGRATSSVHNGMVTYCDIVREGLVFAILDPPANYTAAQMADYQANVAGLFDLSENAAIYWPRVQIANPNTTVFGNASRITVPPCGHLAGLYARVEASKTGGAFEQPAGTEVGRLTTVQALETNEVKNKAKRELLFPLNVNPISQEESTVPGTQTPIFVDGARNLSINGNWPSIGQRRGVQFVQKRLKPGLAFIRHQNIKTRLYQDGASTADQFLRTLTENSCFASDTPSKAYSVDFGGGLNTAVTRKARTVKARIGMATSGPAEFVHVLVGPDNDALEAELAALAAG